MPTAASELLPGYRIDRESGAWCTLPWPDDPDERMAIVRSSLAPALIEWAEWRTDEPGLTHPLTGEPWRFTAGQKRFLMLWYWVRLDGRFAFRRGVKRGAKGTGKDPFAAAMCDMELCAPVELYDWDDRAGRPVARRRGLPLVQIGSNSEGQAKDLLRFANALWSPAAREYYGLDCGDTRTTLKNTFGRIEVNTFAEASNEGDPATFSALNETHHMVTDEGRRVARQARRNVAKSPATVQARSVEYTNAHAQGRDSVAELSFSAWQKQHTPGYPGRQDILYDSIEAPPNPNILTEEGRMAGLRAAYSDAPWADLERLADEMMDAETPVADTIRYYLNGLAGEEDAWVEPGKFDELADTSPLVAGEQIAMFLDCSKSEDATALMACRLRDMKVFTLGVWARPDGWASTNPRQRWLVPREIVDGMVRLAKETWRVEWFGVDPGPAEEDGVLYWQAQIDAWTTDFRHSLRVWATPGAKGHPILFDMRLSTPGGKDRNYRFTKTAELVQSWIQDEGLAGRFRHDGHPVLRTHTHNAKARPNPWGTSLGKVTRDSKRLVDAAVAMVGAVLGARDALGSGKVPLSSGERRRVRVML